MFFKISSFQWIYFHRNRRDRFGMLILNSLKYANLLQNLQKSVFKKAKFKILYQIIDLYQKVNLFIELELNKDVLFTQQKEGGFWTYLGGPIN